MARSLKAKKKAVKKSAVKAATPKVSSLVQAITSPSVKMTYTENAALTYASTSSAVLDLFGLGGALRSRQDSDIASLFLKAFKEDKLLATKCAFYLRDIRGGQGERRTFRVMLQWLANTNPDVIRKNWENIPVYGRWDDLFVLFGTPLEAEMIQVVSRQLAKDKALLKKEGESISILGKWMPSVNTSSKQTKQYAYKFINALDFGPSKDFNAKQRKYRKLLSALRERIAIVERAMCSGDWSSINYEHVPSRASLIYRKAFSKHDATRYVAYLGSVAKGEAKIQTKTLFPYDIVSKVIHGQNDATMELQWKNLPNYLEDNPHNGLVVCDCSGSMLGKRGNSVEPICASISLAMYFAERIEGIFKNHFITFSATPNLQAIKGATLADRISSVQGNAGYNTNLQAVFDLILNKAVQNKVPQAEMPDVIYVISDMEFDGGACLDANSTNLDTIKRKYAVAGYKLPLFVWWNVDARNNQSPVQKKDENMMVVSGFSPSILKNVLANKQTTPYDFMLDVLNGERYENVRV